VSNYTSLTLNWKKLRDYILKFSATRQGNSDQVKEDEMGGSWSTRGWNEECIQMLERKTWREKTSRKK